ncbi:hypothetical protein BH23CHL2_BH23CHL2_07360 [soil metagenome]
MDEQRRAITVSGQGSVATPPDLGHIQLGVRVTNRDTDSALKLANERISRVQVALNNAGIADDDIKLGWFSVTTVHDHVEGRSVFRGYRVSHDLTITVREIGRTGEFLSIAVNAGADDVGGVSFSVEDPTSSTDRARERAFAHARHKAEELARLAGVRLGAVASIRETTHEPVPVERRELRTMAASYAMAEDRAPDVPINPDDAEFTVRMEVVWEIE